MVSLRTPMLLVLVVLAGCSSANSGADAGSVDGGLADAGQADSGSQDAGAPDSGSVADAGGPGQSVACAPTCNNATGLCGPLEVCSTTNPCTDVGGGVDQQESSLPRCKTTDASRPSFDDGPAVTWTDGINGDQRAACEFIPAGASAAAPVPLVVFLHGSHGNADDVYNHTSLRSKAPTYDLLGNGSNAGFALVSMQGRYLHWEGPNPAGTHHDYLYRDLASPSTNPDVRNLDKLIDDLLAGGRIDPSRLYVVGWSNGAFMAELYGVARLSTATPGGHHVAAVAAYAGADPFNTPEASMPACQLAPYPSSTLPILLIHRTCDALVPCDADQQAKFSVPPGYNVEDWKTLAASASGLGDPNITDVMMDGQGAAAAACTAPALCLEATGALNHLRWPDGVADKSGHDWEPSMLSFLASHVTP